MRRFDRHKRGTTLRQRALWVVPLAVLAAGATLGAAHGAGPQKIVIHVDDDAPAGGNGSGKSPFSDIGDALAQASGTPSTTAVVVAVAPGDYHVSSSVRIDRPLALRGSTVLVEGADGWPTGAIEPGTETRIFTTNPAGTLPVVAVGRTDAVVIGDVEIRGFVFNGRLNGNEITLTRVQGFEVVENVFLAPAFIGVQSIASSGRVIGNYFTGVQTGMIAAAGYPGSPSSVTMSGNRSVQNTIGGLLLNGASIDIPEHGDELEAVVRDNDLSGNSISANGFGARLFILRRDPGAPGDSQSTGNIRALIQGNRIVGNRIGITIDAGFPYRRTPPLPGTCDPRVFSGTIDLTLKGNTLTGSVLTPALVTFTRNMAALAPTLLTQWQFLHGATFSIADAEKTLAGAWIQHPEHDPFLGPCPGDGGNEFLDNVLSYNGEVLPYGTNFP